MLSIFTTLLLLFKFSLILNQFISFVNFNFYITFSTVRDESLGKEGNVNFAGLEPFSTEHEINFFAVQNFSLWRISFDYNICCLWTLFCWYWSSSIWGTSKTWNYSFACEWTQTTFKSTEVNVSPGSFASLLLNGDFGLAFAHLFVKVPRRGDSEVIFSVFESSCHFIVLLPV